MTADVVALVGVGAGAVALAAALGKACTLVRQAAPTPREIAAWHAAVLAGDAPRAARLARRLRGPVADLLALGGGGDGADAAATAARATFAQACRRQWQRGFTVVTALLAVGPAFGLLRVLLHFARVVAFLVFANGAPTTDTVVSPLPELWRALLAAAPAAIVLAWSHWHVARLEAAVEAAMVLPRPPQRADQR